MSPMHFVSVDNMTTSATSLSYLVVILPGHTNIDTFPGLKIMHLEHFINTEQQLVFNY